ncbi:MAG: 3-dehydroquinate synthase [Paludibacteraceae bacterium]|nr:3-dehydroquinate synthase [Paludibacteraceae bacterium]
MSENNKSVIYSKTLASDVNALLEGVSSEQLFILTDQQTKIHCLPTLQREGALKNAKVYTMPCGDHYKTIDTVVDIWKFLGENGGTRKSMLINLGGGVVTDLGGFVANTFKRGISFINIPTTLLSMVDAAVGGKTGINFNGLKNEIGVINPAKTVVIYPDFLRSLDTENLLSGYAEMLKHGLLSSKEEMNKLSKFDARNPNFELLAELIETSIEVKANIVKQDPTEKGIRKALNLGHTIGHAFESYSHEIDKPILHGYAVAWGLIGELFLSYKLKGFPQNLMTETVRFIKENYGVFEITCKDYPTLYEYMAHDKKNANAGEVNFTLLSGIGEIVPNCIVDKELIYQALDFYRDSVGI